MSDDSPADQVDRFNRFFSFGYDRLPGARLGMTHIQSNDLAVRRVAVGSQVKHGPRIAECRELRVIGFDERLHGRTNPRILWIVEVGIVKTVVVVRSLV